MSRRSRDIPHREAGPARSSARSRAWGPRPRPAADPPDSASWCVPPAELQDLVQFLAGPAVVPIISQLAVAPHQYGDLRAALGSGVSDITLRSALCHLQEFRLIDVARSPAESARAWYRLTDSGHDLLEPLAGFAGWYRDNREVLTADRTSTDR